jgi:hypothetical protein
MNTFLELLCSLLLCFESEILTTINTEQAKNLNNVFLLKQKIITEESHYCIGLYGAINNTAMNSCSSNIPTNTKLAHFVFPIIHCRAHR